MHSELRYACAELMKYGRISVNEYMRIARIATGQGQLYTYHVIKVNKTLV